MKSEPDAYSIDDLKVDRRIPWTGVRNYQARNMIRDQMKKGDMAFFYHSNCKEPGIAGIIKIAKEAYPDDIKPGDGRKKRPKKNKVLKMNADPANPTWFVVDVQYQRKLKRVITLTELKSHPELEEMPVARKGNRLSITPVSEEQWNFVLELE